VVCDFENRCNFMPHVTDKNMPATPPHIPLLRAGQPYTSLDRSELIDPRSGQPLATVSQANLGLIRRDLRHAREARDVLDRMSCRQLIDICTKAGDIFVQAELPLGDDQTQTPQQYVVALSATSGLPHVMCRRNMGKIHTVLTGMESILRGLTRGLDTEVIDAGLGEQAGVPVSFTARTNVLGVVLPSNSPGVNSIWLPAVAMKIPVALKPGRDEPWTPMRIMQALIAAGYPRQGLGFYPTDHEGADAILSDCGCSILFGDDATTRRYADQPTVQCHGTGRSKIILGPDAASRWRDYLDVMVDSILENGGRSCINTSCIITASHGDEIADALALRLASVCPRPADDESAALAASVKPSVAEAIDARIDRGLRTDGARDVTAEHRTGPRRITVDGLSYLRPTIVRCPSLEHPLGNTEFLFPFAAVVEMSIDDVVDRIGPTLAVTLITRDQALRDALLACPCIDRLNLGAVATTRIEWDQPHEGNLFEFLYRRIAIQCEAV